MPQSLVRFGALWLALTMLPLQAADLTAYSAEWPPYVFRQQGKVVGIAADLLRAACEEARLDCAFEVLPWARAYQTAKRTPGTLVFPTTRTIEREADFRWLGPLGELPGSAWLWRLKDHAVDVAEYRQLNRYRVGVVTGDSPVRELWMRGVKREALDFANANDINIRKFLAGRVVAVIDTDLGMAWQLKLQGVSNDAAVHLLPYSTAVPSYIAVNQSTSPELAERLEAALTKLIRRGEIKTLTQ
jgi:polar amino acid transport system substrate-binding protein